MRTTSKLGIWNQALINIGETEILEDPDDNTRIAAEICNRSWEDVVDDVLAAFPWPWARKQEALSFAVDPFDIDATYSADVLVRDSDGRVYKSLQAANTGNELSDTNWWSYQYELAAGWAYVYVVPDDCITPLYLLGEGERMSTLTPEFYKPFAIYADSSLEMTILATDQDIDNEDFQVLEYIARHEYVAGWPRKFAAAVAWRLAKPLALGLRKDPAVAVNLCEKQFESALSAAMLEALQSGRPDPEADTPSLAAR